MGDISRGVANTLQPAKTIYIKNLWPILFAYTQKDPEKSQTSSRIL
jgi:hypothetical protein